MSPKLLQFYVTVWFFSTLICLVIEGSYLGSAESTVLNQLIPFTVVKVGGIVPIPCLNLSFFDGVWKLLTWDYAFYDGGYEVLRWTAMAMFSPGLAWGIGSFFTAVFAEFVRVF